MMERKQETLIEKLQDGAQTVYDLWQSFVRYVKHARNGQLDARGKRQLIALTIGICIALTVCILLAIPLIKFIQDPDGFAVLLNDNYVLAIITYALINTLHVFIAVIPGEPLELGAGGLFGTWGGLAVVTAGLGLGEFLAFKLVRKYGRRIVNLFVSQETLDGLTLFRDERRRNAITFLMMLIPGTPKDIMAYVTGLTDMRITTWMTIALTARIPSILISTYCGATFVEGSYAKSILVFAFNICLTAFGIYYYALINRQAKAAAAMDRIARQEWEAAGRKRNDATGFDRPAINASNV